MTIAPAYAVHDDDIFELDRNISDSNGTGDSPDDWNTVNLPLSSSSGGHSFVHTGVIADPNGLGPTSLAGGGSKDDLDISKWKWSNDEGVPDKDNMTNAYAAAYSVPVSGEPNHLVVYFGSDRISNDGTAQLGFWFFKNNISLTGAGGGGGSPFSGVHAVGDILVQSNFTSGGTVSTVTVYEWVGSGGSHGTLNQIGTGGDCIPGVGGDNVCATVNQAAVPSVPWPYTPKSNVGDAQIYPIGTFFEGGIDLTALGLTDACFSTFMAESRASAPFDSVLKDFVGPHDFSTCNIEVTKVCANPRLDANQTHIIYDISGQVTASGFGSNVFDVGLSDDPVADGAFSEVNCADSTDVLGSFPLATLNGTACYKNTMTVTLANNGQDDTITATANTGDNTSGIALSDTADGLCPDLQISPAIEVTKACTTSVVVQNNTVVAKVNVTGQVCNIGDTNLSNVYVEDLSIATTPDPLLQNATLLKPADQTNPQATTGACLPYSGSYIPSAALNNSGQETTDPGAVVFKDKTKATANDIFGIPVTPDESDEAVCPLCD